MARTKIERCARAHEVTIVIAAARAFDLGRLCDSRAICRIAAWSSNRPSHAPIAVIGWPCACRRMPACSSMTAQDAASTW